MGSAAAYLADLQAVGRYSFSTEEAVAALGASVQAVQAALRRQKAKGHIADPQRGFHVIVPPEYRRLGCLPADHFVPDLMRHLGEPYYAALLTAAGYHGAAHQRPQVFQVMVAQRRRDIACGAVRVQFVVRHDMAETPTFERNTPRGVLRAASRAATALEVVGYRQSAEIEISDDESELSVRFESGSLELVAPKGKKLGQGRFTNAERAHMGSERRPGISLDWGGRGCNESRGSFTIVRLTHHASTGVESLDVEFEQRCDGEGQASGTLQRVRATAVSATQ